MGGDFGLLYLVLFKEININNKDMKLYFDLKKKDKTSTDGTIRAVIAERKNRLIIYTGLPKIEIKDWINGKPLKIKKYDDLHIILKRYESAFDNYIVETQKNNEDLNLDNAKEFIVTKVNPINSEFGKPQIETVFEKFLQHKIVSILSGGVSTYQTMFYYHLMNFRKNIKLSEIDEDFILQFVLYLTKKRLQVVSINKNLIKLKTFLKWANKKKFTTNNKWDEIKALDDSEKEIHTLELKELKHYQKFKLSDRLARQRDVFIVAAYTAFRYADLNQITKDSIIKVDGVDNISISLDKSENLHKVPISSDIIKILKKYDYKLPVISDQKTNDYVREGLKAAGLNRMVDISKKYYNQKQITEKKPLHEVISIHDARKTFVSVLLEGGMPAEIVKSLSNHKTESAFKRYVKIDNTKQLSKMNKIFK